MRRMILTTLVLLPVMAHAQAGTANGPQPSTSSAMEAELAHPAVPGVLASTRAAAPAASIMTLDGANHAAIHQFIQTKMVENFADSALMKGGTLEYVLMGGAPAQASAPRVTRAVEVALTPEQLAEQPAVTSVVVHAVIDMNGVPRNVSITQSGGPVIDRQVIEAVGQYRFTPAMVDNKPTWSTVSIAIKIQKP